MSIYEQFDETIVDIWSRVNKIEEHALATGLESDVSMTEIKIIEKIGEYPSRRMSDVARAVGVTLATITVACDKLAAKELIMRMRDTQDKRVVNISLTAKGMAAYEFHRQFRRGLMETILGTLSEEEERILSSSLRKLGGLITELDEK